ncbi:hypothetical protein M501DRAFT_922606, partial [Patellaria atrata CBS 101060]
TVQVTVGVAGQLQFDPHTLTVPPGTTLTFNFLSLNHTLTQSSFEHPCNKTGSIDTGFNQFNPQNISGRFLVDIIVNSTRPLWFYCAQTLKADHCSQGMVFSVNP